jgi:hypothetical protein
MSYQVDSYGNAYFPAGVSVASIPATTGTQAKVLVPGVNGRISSATIAQLVTQSGGNIVSSIFGRTGAVIAKEGDYTTDQITETGGALYFSTSRARKSIFLTTFNTSGPATYDTNTGILNIPQYGSGSASVGNYVPLTRTITINGQTADLSVDRIFSVASMVYPSAGIALSNGVSWETSITNNSANWNTAFSWGNHAGLYSLLGHTHTFASLTSKPTTLAGYGITDAATYAQGTKADTAFGWGNHALAGYLTSFTETDPIWTSEKANYALKTYVDTSISNLIDTAPTTLNTLNELAAALGDDANFSTTITTLIGTKEPAITAGTTAQYWRGDKTWQTLPIYTLSGLGGEPSIAAGTTAQYWRGDKSWQTLPIYSLPIATTTILGGVKVDGVTITIDANGVISGANTYVLPTATSTILGGVKIGAGVTITSGVISVSTNYEAPITAGTTSEYWRGDKSWQTLPIYTLAGLGGQAQLNGTGFVKASGTTITYDNSTYYLSSNPSGYISSYTETDTLASVTGRGASTSTAVVINNSLAVNHSSHYDSAQFSLDVNGGLLVKNVGKTALFLLINSNPATGGNNAFVQHTVGGTLSSSFATIQGYYGTSITGSTVLKLNPLGGDVLIGTLIGTGTRMVVADANGVVSTQAIPSVSTIAWTSVTSRPTALSQFTNDLGNYGGWITSYTETDTLASVTARGATTATALTLSSQANNYGGHHYFISYDAAGNHYPHYQNGSSNTGAIVNTRVYTGSGASWRLFVLNGQTAAITWDGNVIYHAGNIPTWNQNTTGTAANITATTNSTLTTLSSLSLPYSQLSGTVPTWNQSTTGNAATVTNATFYRQFTVRDDRSDGSDYSLAARATGLYAINSAGTNGPGYGYLSLIHVANGSDVAFQIAGGYNSDAMYFRGTYALQNGTGYSAWRTVIHSGNIASQTVTYATGETLATVTGRGATTTSAVIINNNLAVNTASPYATATYSLDINGGLLVKNTGRASNITLINADPSGGGNHAFVIHTVSGTLGSSLVDIQGYYGANITGSTTIRLNPLGGNVTINGYTVYHTNNLPSIPTNTNQLTNGANYITSSSLTSYVPYTGATADVNLGSRALSAGNILGITLSASQTSNSQASLVVTNAGTFRIADFNNSGALVAYITNAGGIYGSSFIKSGGSSSQFLKADGSIDSSTYYLASNPSSYITSSGSISGTASNITAYTINQSVGTGNSPTFAGLTVSGPVYQGAANQGVISLLSDVVVGQTNNYFRLYLPQGYYDNRNGGTATIKIVWGMLHAGVTYSQEYKLTFGTNHGAGGNYLHSSQVTKTYSDQNPESYGGYLMDQTPSVDFYQDMSGGYINFNVKGVHGYNTHRVVAVDIVGGGVGTPTLTYYGTTSPGGSALTVKDIPYASTAGSANSVAWTNVSSRPTALSSFTNDVALPLNGNWVGNTGMNDQKLYLRTNGDNNHYLWNAADDWEELIYYTGTGFRIKGSSGVVSALFTDGGLTVDGPITSGGDITAFNAITSGNYTAYSDARLKENIRPIENALQKVIKSRGVLYDRIDSGTKNNIGFIAQELEVNLPELVITDLKKDIKSVNYQNMTAVLVEAIKEQQAQIEEMKKEIKELKNK